MKRLTSLFLLFAALSFFNTSLAQQLDSKEDIYLKQKTIIYNQLNHPIGYYITAENEMKLDIYSLDGLFIESVFTLPNRNDVLLEDHFKENKMVPFKINPINKVLTKQQTPIAL